MADPYFDLNLNPNNFGELLPGIMDQQPINLPRGSAIDELIRRMAGASSPFQQKSYKAPFSDILPEIPAERKPKQIPRGFSDGDFIRPGNDMETSPPMMPQPKGAVPSRMPVDGKDTLPFEINPEPVALPPSMGMSADDYQRQILRMKGRYAYQGGMPGTQIGNGITVQGPEDRFPQLAAIREQEKMKQRQAQGITGSPDVPTLADLAKSMFPNVEVAPGLGRYTDEQMATAARQQMEMMRFGAEAKSNQARMENDNAQKALDRESQQYLGELNAFSKNDMIDRMIPSIAEESMKRSNGDPVMSAKLLAEQVSKMRSELNQSGSGVPSKPGSKPTPTPGAAAGPSQPQAPTGNQPQNQKPPMDVSAEKINTILSSMGTPENYGGRDQYNALFDSMIAKQPNEAEFNQIIDAMKRASGSPANFNPIDSLFQAFSYNQRLWDENAYIPGGEGIKPEGSYNLLDLMGRSMLGAMPIIGGAPKLPQTQITLPNGRVIRLDPQFKPSMGDFLYAKNSTRELAKKRAEMALEMIKRMAPEDMKKR